MAPASATPGLRTGSRTPTGSSRTKTYRSWPGSAAQVLLPALGIYTHAPCPSSRRRETHPGYSGGTAAATLKRGLATAPPRCRRRARLRLGLGTCESEFWLPGSVALLGSPSRRGSCDCGQPSGSYRRSFVLEVGAGLRRDVSNEGRTSIFVAIASNSTSRRTFGSIITSSNGGFS